MTRFTRFQLYCSASILGIALLAPAVWAGGTAVVKAGQDTSTLAWQTSGPVRMSQHNDRDYLLVRDGKAYSVSYEGQKPLVMEIGGLLQGLGAMAQAQSRQYLPDQVEQVEDLHKTETVAGIQGHVYRMTVTDTKGATHTSDAVLTDDARVVDMTQTYTRTLQVMMGADVAQKLTAALPTERRGILRLGNDFVVESISDQEPPASEFELPAEPTSLQNLLQNLPGLQKQ